MLTPSNDYILNILERIRKIHGRVTFELQGKTTVYDNDDIVSFRILEDMSVLNDTLPSNELQITMNNENGDFDLLTLQNMPTILASKPKFTIELGLEYTRINTSVFKPFRYIRDWANGSTANTSSHWNEIQCWSGNTNRCLGLPVTHNGTMLQDGKAITDGDITTYNSATAKQGGAFIQIDLGALYSDIDTIKIYHYYADGRTYYGTKTEVSEDGINWVTVFDSAISGTYKETSAGNTIRPYAWEEEYIEWVKMGSFFLTSWKNDISNKIISMIANDYFFLFSELSYTPKSNLVNLGELAKDVLLSAGVPEAKIIIDSSLFGITVNPFPERIGVREALQHIGIASRSAVFQDREGNIVIKPFKTIDVAGNYILYPTEQRGLFSYPSAELPLYSWVSTGAGMKYIDFEDMYDVPEISLEKSIYTLIVVSYENGWTVDNINFNPALAGDNGVAFKIDNPLVNSGDMAKAIAEWYFKESNYNAIYRTRWRGNPVLECADIVLIEDSFGAEKQSRIFRQEFNYQGYLESYLETRGGI